MPSRGQWLPSLTLHAGFAHPHELNTPRVCSKTCAASFSASHVSLWDPFEAGYLLFRVWTVWISDMPKPSSILQVLEGQVSKLSGASDQTRGPGVRLLCSESRADKSQQRWRLNSFVQLFQGSPARRRS